MSKASTPTIPDASAPRVRWEARGSHWFVFMQFGHKVAVYLRRDRLLGGPVMREPVLSLRGISKRYGPLEVLKNVDVDVYSGEVVALLGENGAGKSTLSGIIAGSREPSEGTMTWLGEPYAPSSPRAAIDKGV